MAVSTAVCQDLVSFDQADRNPFRGILPLAGCFDFLEAILVATGAMHLSALRAGGGRLGGQEFLDALAAKDRAIRLLQAAIQDVSTTTPQTVLAATVFLINLDLIDSGQGAWQAHMKAAGTLIPELLTPDFTAKDPSMAACIDAIAADCLTYHVLAAAITGVTLPSSWAANVHNSSGYGLTDFLPVLQRTEAYAYHCCPPTVVRLLSVSSSHSLSWSKLGPSTLSDGFSASMDYHAMITSVFASMWLSHTAPLHVCTFC
jgi:hypothetical protein